jgi:uncharacterized protein YijF (DUF1287 family)
MVLALLCGRTAEADNRDLVRAARQQVGVTVIYDGSYHDLAYPGGDLPRERGVCTDVVVRALRVARSLDLQKLVHEDMSAHFAAYPAHRRWDLGGNVLHIGIVSDRRAVTGVPLVIHNIGAGTREEDVLFSFAIVGHYRL